MSDTDVRCRHADSFTRECDSCYRTRARYYWQKDQAERDDLRSRTATLTADLERVTRERDKAHADLAALDVVRSALCRDLGLPPDRGWLDIAGAVEASRREVEEYKAAMVTLAQTADAATGT